MLPDAEALCESLVAREDRFDPLAFVCAKTTGIYCRFGCPARTPLRRNVEFRETAAACLAAGFRACKRCRPDQTGSPAGRSSSSASKPAPEAMRHI
jgi:methylphosphotriester-DNA--protein-cysteine methyltransferase